MLTSIFKGLASLRLAMVAMTIIAVMALPIILLINTLLLFMTYVIVTLRRFAKSLNSDTLDLTDNTLNMESILGELSRQHLR